MNDERRETYQRLVVGLLALPRTKTPTDPLVSCIEVITLLAEELLTERRGEAPVPRGNPASSQPGESDGGCDSRFR